MWTEIKMKEDDNFSVLGQTVPKTVEPSFFSCKICTQLDVKPAWKRIGLKYLLSLNCTTLKCFLPLCFHQYILCIISIVGEFLSEVSIAMVSISMGNV